MKILHITAHMGAGAGKAIAGIITSDQDDEHRIIITQDPVKRNHIEKCLDVGIEILICPTDEQLTEWTRWAEVIVIDWWHHPSIFETLLKISDIEARIVIWNHINGLNYPRLSGIFLREFDGIMFTSKASFDNHLWTEDQSNEIKKKAALVYGMGDFNPEECIQKLEYDISEEIRIGYVGSLDYAKLHPEFVKWMHYTIAVNNRIRFFVVGEPTEDIIADINKNRSDKVELCGFRSDIKELLPTFDIFVYPLNPMNFATTENALLEAMAAGLPIVATDGVVERNIIDNKTNGILVHDAEEFCMGIQKLINNKELRKELGANARNSVSDSYEVKKNVGHYQQMINKVSHNKKRKHRFADIIGTKSYDWFLSGCDSLEKRIFDTALNIGKEANEYALYSKKIKDLGKIFSGKEKGSINQFSYLYPDDEKLVRLLEMVNAKAQGDVR